MIGKIKMITKYSCRLTKKHLEANYCDNDNCSIALALKDAGATNFKVYPNRIYFKNTNKTVRFNKNLAKIDNDLACSVVYEDRKHLLGKKFTLTIEG